MTPVRVIYARSHTLAGLLIRHRDDGSKRRWSHAGVVIEYPDEDTPTVVWEARFGKGFGCVALGDFRRRYAAYEMVRYDVPDAEAGYAWLAKQEQKPYALGTVLARAVGIHLDDDGTQCAEAVEGYLAACGLRRWRDGLHLVTPNASFNHLGGCA